MSFSETSKWIWQNSAAKNDSYALFKTDFSFDGERTFIRLSADSNYTLFINGSFVNSGQYPDFPHYKVYDELEITDYCKKGENTALLSVWYYGLTNMSYYPGDAAIRFEIFDEVGIKTKSDGGTLSCLDTRYAVGREKNITGQLGLTFAYDCTEKIDDSLFKPSRVLAQSLPLYPRPVEKLSVGERAPSELIKTGKDFLLFDLSREEVGYLTFRLFSEKKQTLIFSYGEHITDGRVRRIIGDRDFSFEITVDAGENEYTNYFRRLGLRYLEISFDAPVTVDYATVLPTLYPVKRLEKHFDSPLHQKIYDVSVRTLELCMHDHYEDCPWREQALYAMDGRNQIICGYHAFNEFKFPRANLYLMSKDEREDGLLSICTPTRSDLTIPSFSLHYFTEIYEYSVYSGDLSLAREVMPKLKRLINVFLSHLKHGIVPRFPEKCHWNFYEWSEGLSGGLFCTDNETVADAALNLLLSVALQNLQKTCELIGEEADYLDSAWELNESIRKIFFDRESGLFFDTCEKRTKSELVNALAILSGAVSGAEAEHIASVLAKKNSLTDITMSMACFKYDALLKTDRERYKAFIIEDIENRYTPMLNAGATSFWETEKGEADFENAGSLCHGWSAMPIYYFSLLLG